MNEPIDDHTIALVRESFDLIEPIAPQAGAFFYANLFEFDPSLRRLFPGDITAHAATLMQQVGLAVSRLDAPEALTPMLEDLGRRHAGHGVKPADYDTAGAAVLKTLYQALGVAYNEDVEAAWVAAYGAAAGTMKKTAAVAPVTG